MKVAVISDIHSNCFALKAVLRDIQSLNVDRLLILGDMFGYYPWAVESYDLLESSATEKVYIKGNHDELIIQRRSNKDLEVNPAYQVAVEQNFKDLERRGLLDWLTSLPALVNMSIDGLKLLLCHGTPADLLYGRFYPDSQEEADWFPKKNHVVLMGHTHYPLLKICRSGGIIANPGSVGQPRDGDPQPAWMLVDFSKSEFSHMRSNYDYKTVQTQLVKMGWTRHAIEALGKKSPS